MICFPNAKINIGLQVFAKRTDGFHDIESVFVPIALNDILEFIPQPQSKSKYVLHLSGLRVDGNGKDNLVVKAYQLLDEQMSLPPVAIYLHKIIPMGAGLGGGSANGAFALVQLNRLFQLGLTNLQLEEYASILGSDCPFFIQNKPALIRGRGNIIEPLVINEGKDYFIIVLNPGIHVATEKAYAHIIPGTKKPGAICEIVKLPVNEWSKVLSNDFEPYVFGEFPEIKEIKDELYRQGALFASMTGSGSSVYGIFADRTDLKDLFPSYYYWSGRLNFGKPS